jgi:membrane-bound metal-dependent hydrolase YbcI (DUF457 family)
MCERCWSTEAACDDDDDVARNALWNMQKINIFYPSSDEVNVLLWQENNFLLFILSLGLFVSLSSAILCSRASEAANIEQYYAFMARGETRLNLMSVSRG